MVDKFVSDSSAESEEKQQKGTESKTDSSHNVSQVEDGKGSYKQTDEKVLEIDEKFFKEFDEKLAKGCEERISKLLEQYTAASENGLFYKAAKRRRQACERGGYLQGSIKS